MSFAKDVYQRDGASYEARTKVYVVRPGGIARYEAERKRIRLKRRKAAKRGDFKLMMLLPPHQGKG